MSTKANGWNSPICITLIAATLALMGNIIATVLQTRTAEQLAHQRIQADLILQATKDPQLANQNLWFFLNEGMIEDPNGHLRHHFNGGNPPDKLPPFFGD